MIDIVIPRQNEEEFIRIAVRLGYDSLCFYYNELKTAYLQHIEALQAKTKLRLYTASSVARKFLPDIMIVKTIDPRQYIENRKIDMVFGMENSREKDSIKQRRSGLNQVLCSLAKEKNKIIGLDFGSLLTAGPKRHVAIGRIKQNIMLCRKYKVETAICSFAYEPLQMRNPVDLKALFSVLGMEAGDIKGSFESVEKRAVLNRRKANKEIISEGIEKV